MKIAIPFAQTDAENPNIAIQKQSHQNEIYMRNIVVSFASLRKFNPKLELQLITNKEVKITKLLEQLNVEVSYIPFTFEPPEIYGKRFRGCFYIFDGINSMTASTLFIDPDILCMNTLDTKFFDLLDKSNLLGVLDLQFTTSKEVNGLTHSEAARIYSEISNKKKEENFHVGGEAFYVPITLKNQLIYEVNNYWKIVKLNSQRSLLPTEEHILSVLLPSFKYTRINHIVKRIWTSKSYRRIEGGTFGKELPLWHLPAEKSRGFLRVYKSIVEDEMHLDLNFFSKKKLILRIMHLNFSSVRKVQSFLFYLAKKII